MGMMPSSEIKLRGCYDTGHGLKANIDAGDHGWTITYADYSSDYKDEDQSAELNYAAALEVLKSHFKTLIEVKEYEDADDLSDLVESES